MRSSSTVYHLPSQSYLDLQEVEGWAEIIGEGKCRLAEYSSTFADSNSNLAALQFESGYLP